MFHLKLHIDTSLRALYQHCSYSQAMAVSKHERSALGLEWLSLVYGESSLEALLGALWGLQLQAGGVFYDLGSGTGSVVIAATMAHCFARCR